MGTRILVDWNPVIKFCDIFFFFHAASHIKKQPHMSGFTCTNNQISYIAQIEQTVVTNGDCLQLNSIDISKDATGRVYTRFF